MNEIVILIHIVFMGGVIVMGIHKFRKVLNKIINLQTFNEYKLEKFP